MLYLIGLGLSDEKDITVKGLEAVRRSERVYLEAYTSILMVEKDKLEEFYGKKVITATREMVELESDDILAGAKEVDIAFLVVGDPLGYAIFSVRAIPHHLLILSPIPQRNNPYGPSASCYGPWRSDSDDPQRLDPHRARLDRTAAVQLWPIDLAAILYRDMDARELVRPPGGELQDRNAHLGPAGHQGAGAERREHVQVSWRGRLIYEPPRFMDPQTAFQQMIFTENERAEQRAEDDAETEPKPETPVEAKTYMDPEKTLVMSLSRIGTSTQSIISGTLAEMAKLTKEDFGGPLHSVVVVGSRIHPLELEFAGRFCLGGEGGAWWKVGKEVYGVVREGEH
ncbi:hypothetical protein P7C73_g2730, partial [Tremellales sp. Uapishka_1]